jgi:hypothetical protein
MQLTTKELRDITLLLLKVMDDHGYSRVSFSEEDYYYQKIDFEDRNFGGKPQIGIGSLEDDIGRLKRASKGAYPILADLDRLGAVFTALGAVLTRDR